MERYRFLAKDTVEAAERLLGWELVRRTERGVIRIRITETEAYKGGDDPASHASRGVTARNRLMFGDVGYLYVYLIYGMHHCMNIVAHEPGEVGAVLLRGGTALEGIDLIRRNRPGVSDRLLLDGPGKLAQGLGIDLSWNGYFLLEPGASAADGLRLEPGQAEGSISRTPRIGITKAKELPWRFVLEPSESR
ncbi:DNA-3-methyladenine glycosylase [Paenibacillus antri]|uniref:Putative 3-methyladenine DNA glycosylase n=1 Tax=Paenibacillus antri TaxID=2582848 RepID=A0A5R9GEZ3_9BACL|nr:DNA-3-methyladenine glycosylase [Paenibacillus antri]TLS52700.1 DNA-3-methyladenine glycosylase [Paenibacillus antri]